MATHASLIAGFSFNALVKENFSNDVPLHVKGLFSIFTVMGIVLLLHSVFISTLCIVCGPNLAMRGKDPEKSVDQAVKGMVAARRNVYGSFVAGIVVFQFSVMLWIVARLGYFHGGRGGVGWATLCGLLIVVVMGESERGLCRPKIRNFVTNRHQRAHAGITCVAAYYLYSMYFKLSLYSVDSEWMAFKQQANLHPDLNEDRIGEPSHESSSLLKGRFTCQVSLESFSCRAGTPSPAPSPPAPR